MMVEILFVLLLGTAFATRRSRHWCRQSYGSLYLAAVLLVSSQATAQIYKWTDSDGRIHYSDAKNTPDSAISKEVDLGVLNTTASTTSDSVGSPPGQVVMYATSWCGYCKKARSYFRKKGIPFTEYDIEKSPSAAARHKELGGAGVPLIVYQDRLMSGFTEAGFERIYKDDT